MTESKLIKIIIDDRSIEWSILGQSIIYKNIKLILFLIYNDEITTKEKV